MPCKEVLIMPKDAVPIAPNLSAATFSSFWFPLVVLTVSFAATFFLWRLSDRERQHRAEARFNNQIEEITGQILNRLRDNENILLGGNALFAVRGDSLTRKEWHQYATSLKLEAHNPGILGFGYSAWLTPEGKEAHIRAVRTEGFPDYTVKPEGERPFYTSILWLEPFNEMNRRAFGYDMYSEPVRQAAMDRARDTGMTSISGRIILVQETDENVQFGILMYLPSYRWGMPIDTVEQRRGALRGFVYSPIRMNDFIHGALTRMPESVDLAIYSGQQPLPGNLLFSSRQVAHRSLPSGYEPKFSTSRTIDAYGAAWQLTFHSLPSFDQEFSRDKSLPILFSGALASLLLCALAFMQARSRRQALIIADHAAEQLLAQQKFALHIQQTPLAVIEWNEHLRVTMWNPAAEKIFGYAAEDAIGSPISFLFLENARDDGANEVLAILPNKDNNQSACRNLTKEGRVIDCEWYSTTLVDREGTILGVIALVHDVTERKVAEEQLRAERNILQTVMNGAKNSHLVFLDRDFNFVRVNATYAATCGYRPEEMIGKNHFALYPDTDNEAIFTRVRESGEPFEVHDKPFEFPDQPERGVTWWDWTLTPIKDQSGRVSGLVFSLIETTRRKKAELALQASETQFRFLFEQHSAIMLLIEPTSRKILNANEAAAKFYGYPREQLRTMTMEEINCLPQEEILSILRQVNEKTISHFIAPHRLADGTIRTVEVYAAPIFLQEQRLNFAIIHDITDRIQAEADREKLEEQNRLLQKTESLGRMAGAIAHHFNNQLQAVMMSLEMTLGTLADVEQERRITRFLTTAINATGKAAEVSKLLLTYLGQTTDLFESEDLADICRGYQPILLASMPGSVQLRTVLPQPGPMINTNVSHIQQLLTNLISNAWESCSNKSGSVSLSVYTLNGNEIPAKNRFPIDFQPHADGYACLEVRDTGSGIADENIEKLFDPFFSSKFTGRGMGLAVVLGIVRAHQGAITVESQLGQGSVFRLFFPEVIREASARVPLPEQPVPDLPCSGTILVVDDEPVSRKLVAHMLKSLGYSVLQAENGVQAVELFDRHQDEVVAVLCDVTMPLMNGWETLAALRSRSPRTPVILASGFTEIQVMQGHHAELPQAFLEKPYRFAKLRDTLAYVLKKSEDH
jgi:PAS domain S-box-containing protein